jgi:hypothetical protein
MRWTRTTRVPFAGEGRNPVEDWLQEAVRVAQQILHGLEAIHREGWKRRARLAGDHDLVDALARDHLVDHPDSYVVSWIAFNAAGPDRSNDPN